MYEQLAQGCTWREERPGLERRTCDLSVEMIQNNDNFNNPQVRHEVLSEFHTESDKHCTERVKGRKHSYYCTERVKGGNHSSHCSEMVKLISVKPTVCVCCYVCQAEAVRTPRSHRSVD